MFKWIGKQIVLTGLVFVMCWAPLFTFALAFYGWLAYNEDGMSWDVYNPLIFMGAMITTFYVAIDWYRKVRKW